MSDAPGAIARSDNGESRSRGFYNGGDMIPGSGLGSESRIAKLATSNVDSTRQVKTSGPFWKTAFVLWVSALCGRLV
jgi:hypothetical protein